MLLESIGPGFNALLCMETWDSENYEPPSFGGYKCTSLARKTKRGGGVAIYFRQNIPFYMLNEFLATTIDVESL